MQADSQPFVRYLEAKKPVDDRSLNVRVWEALSQAIRELRRTESLQVLELGCGIGTMLERMLERGLLERASYLGIDSSSEVIGAAERRMPDWAAEQGLIQRAVPSGGHELSGGRRLLQVDWRVVDALEYAQEASTDQRYDLLVAHAFLDLIDLPSGIQALLPLLRPDGVFYFSLVFDGATILEPEVDAELDAHIERLYHATMDTRTVRGRPSGDSRSGRHLFRLLREAGAGLLEAGSSDWVVFPRSGMYREHEHTFLRAILEFFESSLHDHPELDPEQFVAWMQTRRAQLDAGELIYIAHQLDFVGQRQAHP